MIQNVALSDRSHCFINFLICYFDFWARMNCNNWWPGNQWMHSSRWKALYWCCAQFIMYFIFMLLVTLANLLFYPLVNVLGCLVPIQPFLCTACVICYDLGHFQEFSFQKFSSNFFLQSFQFSWLFFISISAWCRTLVVIVIFRLSLCTVKLIYCHLR